MEELVEKLEMILADEYSASQLKIWLNIKGSSSDGNMIDFITDELENDTLSVEEAAEQLSCFIK